MYKRNSISLKPFVKWSGGKGSLVKDIIKFIPSDAAFTKYAEPFVGGGAMFFYGAAFRL